jgi:hypothetical protein
MAAPAELKKVLIEMVSLCWLQGIQDQCRLHLWSAVVARVFFVWLPQVPNAPQNKRAGLNRRITFTAPTVRRYPRNFPHGCNQFRRRCCNNKLRNS